MNAGIHPTMTQTHRKIRKLTTISMKQEKECNNGRNNSKIKKHEKYKRNGIVSSVFNQSRKGNKIKSTTKIWDNRMMNTWWHTEAGWKRHRKGHYRYQGFDYSHNARRQLSTKDKTEYKRPPAEDNATVDMRYTQPTTTQSTRTTPSRVSLQLQCDYNAYYCMKAYVTGRVCARTSFWTYMTFKNYCMMDYVNCVERWEVWHIIHMGPCFKHDEFSDYVCDSQNCLLQRRHGTNNLQQDTVLKFFKRNRNTSTNKPILYDFIPPPKRYENETSKRKRNFTFQTVRRGSFTERRRLMKAFTLYGKKSRKLRNWAARRQGPPGRPVRGSDIPPTEEMRDNVRSTVNNRLVRTGKFFPILVNDTKPEYCGLYTGRCMRAYNTGVICGRTVYLTYHTFTNYCMLDYTNCMERYEVWQIAHYGPCFNISILPLVKHFHYQYSDDYWLDGNIIDPMMT